MSKTTEPETPDQLASPRRRPRSLKALGSFLSTANANRGLERYRRAGITATTSFLSKALTILISFASVPLTVHYLGPERYGVWLVISSLLIWMSLTDFGLAGNALVNVIADAHGKDDRHLARQYSASALWALVVISILLGLIFVATFHLIPWRTVFRVSAGVSSQELEKTCALTLLMFVLGLPLSIFPSLYNAYQDGFLSNIWSMTSNLLALISLIVVSQYRGGLPLLVLAISGTRMLVVAASGVYAFTSRYKWLSPSPASVRWSCVRRLFQLGGKYMVTQLAALGIYQSQPLIITQMLGPAQVTTFVIAYKVIALPVDLAYMATAPFISAFSEAKSRGEWDWIKGAYIRSTRLCVLLGVPFIACIAVIAKPLIRLWAGALTVPTTGVVIGLSVYTLVSVVMMSAGQMLAGLERLNQLALSVTLCAISIIGLGILFSPWWGLSGIAIGMAISKVLTFLPVQVLETRRVLAMSKAVSVTPIECQLVP